MHGSLGTRLIGTIYNELQTIEVMKPHTVDAYRNQYYFGRTYNVTSVTIRDSCRIS